MKQSAIQKALSVLSFLALIISAFTAQANHIAGGTLTYSHIGGRQYIVKLQLVRSCEASSNSSPFLVLNPVNILIANTCNQSFAAALPHYSLDTIGFRCGIVSANCGGTVGRFGFVNYTWLDTITLPNIASSNCDNWRMTYGGNAAVNGLCCIVTVDNINTSGTNSDIFLQAHLTHNSMAGNSSPQFNISQMPVFCVNNPVGFRLFGPESDGDSVVYSLVSNKNSLTTTSNYNAPLTGSNPFFAVAGSTSIQPATGLIRFTPSQQQNVWISVLAEEFRQGNKVGESRISLPVLVTANAICNLYVTQSFSGCGLVTLPDGRFFASDTTVFDTIPGLNACDTIKQYNINVTPIQTTGQIEGAAFVARNSSEIYRAEQFAQASTNTWMVLGGTIVNSNNDSALVSWGNDSIGRVSITSIAPNGCVNSVQKAIQIGNTTSVESRGDLQTILYPQPAQDFVSIKSNVPMATLTVFNSKGAKMMVQHPNADGFKLELQGLSNGLYFVKITYQNQQESQHRLLIQK